MLVSSDLMYTELARSGRRVGVTALDLNAALDAIDYIPMTTEIFVAAGDVEPDTLRSLDALHFNNSASRLRRVRCRHHVRQENGRSGERCRHRRLRAELTRPSYLTSRTASERSISQLG